MLGLLLQIWNALTSCSERMNPYSPVAAVLLQIWNTAAAVLSQIWRIILIFTEIHDPWVPQSLRS